MRSIINFLVILPLIGLIHELGHAFFVKIFGGKVTKIQFGWFGKKICSIGIFEINQGYFLGARITHSDLKLKNKLTVIITLMGGIIFNIVSVVIIDRLAFLYNPHYMNSISYDPVCIYIREFVKISISVIIVNALPVKFFKRNTDGRQIYQMLRYGKSRLFDDEVSVAGPK